MSGYIITRFSVSGCGKCNHRNFRKAQLEGRESSGELEALRAEIDELRNLPPRMAELEERLDFAERMLTQQRETLRLPEGPDAAR